MAKKKRTIRRRAAKRHPADSKAIARWGEHVMRSGFTIVPNSFLYNQDRLKLTPNEFNVLLHLMSFWWEKERLPYPSKTLIASRMRKNNRTVQRAFAQLEAKGYLSRQLRYSKGNRRTSGYDLQGLVSRIEAIRLNYADYRE
ncbi:helix-turn-helix domain-containing protein [Bradyrhizobium sp. USDA 336]|uniref:helix-turn-helix domain-containing protein n=1 Tax=Bradyrhizobium sp. USDA 336 TaxID=3156311 RepID=UPI003839C4F1